MWVRNPQESKDQCLEPGSGPHDNRVLKLEQVSVGALTGISLTIAPGEIVCLSGSSGSGKSRLLRAIADLDVHGGEVWLGNMAQAAVKAHRWRGWVMLVPSESPWWAERVADHFAEHQDLDRELAGLGLEPGVLGWQVGRLSSGEKQRLALLRACSYGPRALLLDEPTANLDPELTLNAEDWLARWARTQQLPVLWVSHDKAQIGRVADRHYHVQGSRLEHQ
ncbi:ABC transporter ATP-binding protein [Zobellella maritima]|uniref:ABC transporter ATP-binding protein n=1 Tax=Zobellella maritima TaxID=2059725 RepID=UPI001E44E111|nr:ATP-binding cassette domain-containing protein [Zobellella maritima]